MKFSLSYNDSTLWVKTSQKFCDLLRKSQPTQSMTLFIQHVAKYIWEISKLYIYIYIYIYINSPRWVLHPTLSSLPKEQIQHPVAAFGINLLQQNPRSLVKKVTSSSPTTLLSQNWYRWSSGHGRQSIANLH